MAGNYQSSAKYLGILFLTFWILLSYLVPISLFVTMEIVKFALVRSPTSCARHPTLLPTVQLPMVILKTHTDKASCSTYMRSHRKFVLSMHMVAGQQCSGAQ